MVRIVMLAGFLVNWSLTADGYDVLHFADDREPAKCKVEALGDDFLVARVVVGRNNKPTISRVTIKLADLAFVDFELSELDTQLQQKVSEIDYEKLRRAWQKEAKWLDVKRSNAGAYGIAVAERLLASGEPSKQKVGLETFKDIEKRDWNESRRLHAQQGRLRSLIALGRPEEALAEAKTIAQIAEQPEILVETRLVMAVASRKRLETLVEDNPKWREDDDVRDEVRQALDETVHGFLFPGLFHGSLEEPSARGLWNVCEVYQLGNESRLAIQSAKDLLALYPASNYAQRAGDFLQSMAGK